jgi:hypothetical protein
MVMLTLSQTLTLALPVALVVSVSATVTLTVTLPPTLRERTGADVPDQVGSWLRVEARHAPLACVVVEPAHLGPGVQRLPPPPALHASAPALCAGKGGGREMEEGAGRRGRDEDRVVAEGAVGHGGDVEDGRRVRPRARGAAHHHAAVLGLDVHRPHAVRRELVVVGVHIALGPERRGPILVLRPSVHH